MNQLRSRGYDVSEYENFSVNEIHILNQNNQLDMLLDSEDKNSDKKCYIKYHMTGKLTKGIIDDTLDDLFTMDVPFTEDDDVIIIVKDKVNDTLKSFITNLFNKDKKFVSVYNINRYLFNILEHSMVPLHEPLFFRRKRKV